MSVPSPDRRRLKLTKTLPNKKGALAAKSLILDEFVEVIDQSRWHYHLSSPSFSLAQMEEICPWIKDTIAKVILRTIEVQSEGVWAVSPPLLSRLGGETSGPVGTPRYRIPRESVDYNLRRVLEAALQTLTLLPGKDPGLAYGPKNIRALSLRLSKWADQVREALAFGDVYNRFSSDDQSRLRGLHVELAWTADALKKALPIVERIKIDSPNPQVRFALYLVGFLEASTGRTDYESARMLIDAAFTTAKKTPPKWIDRLPIEMHAKRKKRRAWIRRITLPIQNHGHNNSALEIKEPDSK